jgi:hypothetical protein
VVINELLFLPDPTSPDAVRTHPWIEIFNKGSGPVDLTSWKVSARDGQAGGSARALPSVILPGGAYLVVHFASGAGNLDFSSGSGDYYTGDDPSTPYWNGTQDEAALYSPDAIVDFLSWTSTTTVYQPGPAHGDAVAAGIWSSGSALTWDDIRQDPSDRWRVTLPGVSLGRNASSFDSDRPSDFDTHGGVNAQDDSPGRQNFDYLYFLAASEPGAAASAKSNNRAASGAKWTVLIYAAADNSLEMSIYANLIEIENQVGGSTADVNLILMYDGKASSVLGRIDTNLNVVPATSPGGTFRGRLINATEKYVVLESPNGESPDLGEKNMGDPATLKEFIEWGKSRYPAEKYALIISSHGKGWKRVASDESSSGSREEFDALYMGELTTALAGQQFELLAFDACLMGMIEVAWQVQPFTQWLVSSQESVPGLGLGYPQWIPQLTQNSSWDGRALGRAMVQGFKQYYETHMLGELRTAWENPGPG